MEVIKLKKFLLGLGIAGMILSTNAGALAATSTSTGENDVEATSTLTSVSPLAATSSPKSVTLNSDDFTATTSRILLSSGQKLYVGVSNYWYSGYQIQYSIFKNGSEFSTGFVSINDTVTFNEAWAPGEYSLRLYCNSQSNQKKGCSAGGNLTVQ